MEQKKEIADWLQTIEIEYNRGESRPLGYFCAKLPIDKIPKVWYNWRPEHSCARPNFNYNRSLSICQEEKCTNLRRAFFPILCNFTH